MVDVLHNLIFPNPAFAFSLFFIVILDLMTGIFKSKKKGVATASQGMKKSVQKLTTYLSLVTLSLILTNLAKLTYDLDDYINELDLGINSVCFWLIHLEVKSILENLVIANTNDDGERNDIGDFLVKIHNAWILKFKDINEFNYSESKRDIIKKIKS